MQHLFLDLGTKCGWAMGSKGHSLSGVWNLKGGRYDGGGMRFVLFKKQLDTLYDAYKFERVFYEEVRRHLGTDAAHVYGGLMATLTAWCEERGIPYLGVSVGDIKKSWCGTGNASKTMMIDEALARGFRPQDDNEADALAGLHWSLTEFAAA